MLRTAAALILTLSISGGAAFAAEGTEVDVTTATATSAYEATAASVTTPTRFAAVGTSEKRPAALPVLYASFAALQAFDFYSTRQVLAMGGREANPAMKGIVGNTAAFAAIKAATTLGPMLIAQRMWKTNRVGAIMTMVVANGAMAYVAANNARVLKQLR